MMIRKDQEWIYKTLKDAFNRESDRECESVGHIELRPRLPYIDDEALQIAKALLEIDYIEFEVNDDDEYLS